MSTSKVSKSEREAAIERLREWVKDGDTVYCVLKHRSSSGMSRVIQLVTINCSEGKPDLGWIGYNVAKAIGYGYDEKREGVRIGGCGMDMGFALVDDLRAKLGYKKLTSRWI